MADDRKQSAGNHEINLICRRADAGLGSKLPQVDTEHSLGDVTEEDQKAADGAKDAVGVGRPVALWLPILTRIGLIQDLADDKAARNGACEIGQNQEEDTGHHKRSPSFLPRRISRMGVPSKPKVSRSRFSKKRRYEKVHELGLIDEQDKGRRLDRSLGHVIDFQQSSAFSRRRIGKLGIFDEFV